MGISKIFGRFFIFLFCTFSAWILFINLYAFSRGENTYFGFTSMFNMFNEIPTLPSFNEDAYITIGNINISVYLPNMIKMVYQDAIGTALDLFGFTGSTASILSVVLGIFHILTAPVRVILDLLIVIASILWDLIDLVPFIFKLLKGGYNVPLI